MSSIKQVYKDVENGKKNQVKSDTVTMDLQDFIDEHEELVKILRSGSKEELLKEASDQEKELLEEKKKHGV